MAEIRSWVNVCVSNLKDYDTLQTIMLNYLDLQFREQMCVQSILETDAQILYRREKRNEIKPLPIVKFLFDIM